MEPCWKAPEVPTEGNWVSFDGRATAEGHVAPSSALRRELEELFRAARLPTSPALAGQILRLIRDERSTLRDFADVISADPALSARLIKAANSAWFGQTVAVTRIERAVAVLGLHRVKISALGLELVTHVNRLGRVPFDMKLFWRDCLLRACLGRGDRRARLPPV